MRSDNESGKILAKASANWKKSTLTSLFELGLSPNLKGFGCTLEAILVYRQDPGQSIMKDIYPAVARLQSPGVSPVQVERNIRRAIGLAWQSRDEAVWVRFFPNSKHVNARKPTNYEFISQVAWHIELCEEWIDGNKGIPGEHSGSL